MQVIHTIKEMQQAANSIRVHRETIAFVPTMGFLHEGHLSLLRIARERANQVVLSIFVNPAQFGPNEDFDSYPRALEADLEMAKKEGVDLVFAPVEKELYQDGYQTFVELTDLPHHLCGLSRPVFFKGITTVVSQLFNIVKPHFAVFGEKDFQQLAIIRQLVKDLKFDVDIIGGPIVREEDGLAMSSRNAYLKEGMRPAALTLSQALAEAKDMVAAGTTNADAIIENTRKIFDGFPSIKVDYISIADTQTLDPVSSVDKPTLMALAVNLENIRLIDNTVLFPS